MRIVTWTIRLVVFVLLVAFAAKNADPVTLRFYFDLALQTPLVLVLFGFFAAGALFGMLALLGTAAAPAARDLLPEEKHVAAAARRRADAAGDSEPMEFEYWWLLGFAAVLRLGLDGGAHRHPPARA